ncbi:FAD-dependent monooxygenase [Streptomyces sp. NPDC054784]
MSTRGVLISGAGISGPALAYWLRRAGYAVTVVEKADAPRAGGYPIDIRGSAVEVVRRMGILPRLREAHTGTRRYTFLDTDGGTVASLGGAEDHGGEEGDLEVRRGDLSESLYALVRDDVEFRFDDSIDVLDQSGGAGVDVTFRSGARRTYDLVVGADGMHSQTREGLFGPEERFRRDLGYSFAVFTVPNTSRLSRELVMWNSPGRAAALYALGEDEPPHAFLTFHRTFHRPDAPHDALRDPDAFRDPDACREVFARVFADAGGEVPRLLDAIRHADDLFCDTAAQIRMPRWSSGRVALVGDAAHAPSFLTGQGSSLALSGAYVLAHALAGHRERPAAFAAYERGLRGFVTANQGLVDDGGARLFPTTAAALERRNAVLRGLAAMPSLTTHPAHTALTLPPPPGGR